MKLKIYKDCQKWDLNPRLQLKPETSALRKVVILESGALDHSAILTTCKLKYRVQIKLQLLKKCTL